MREEGDKLNLLVCIASYGTANDKYLRHLIDDYNAMPYPTDVVVLSNIAKDLGPDVEVVVGLPTKNPWSLPFGHKQLFADRLNDYDLFIYSEDDTPLSANNIAAFLKVDQVLADNEIAGFLRVEAARDGTKSFCDVHGPFHWDPASVRRRGAYTLAHFTNEHSACFLLTRTQLERAIDSGGFLVDAHEGKYDMLCTAATDPYTQCGLRKLIPISHFNDFVVPHLPNKYADRLGIKETELRRQIETLLDIGNNTVIPYSLFETETKLAGAAYSKNYYEPVCAEVMSAIPDAARSILSIGCGSGATEAWLAKNGRRVVAVPLDPVISSSSKVEDVQLVLGTMKAARERLEGESFDCLLLSNALQFVKDPVQTLSSFVSLLRGGSVAVAVVPNFGGIPRLVKRVLGDRSQRGLADYASTGVHPSSRQVIRKWFRDAGLTNDKVINVLAGRAEMVSRLTLGLADGVLASELVAVARKN